MSLFHLGNAVHLIYRHFPLRFPAITHQTGCFISPVYFSRPNFSTLKQKSWSWKSRLKIKWWTLFPSACRLNFPMPRLFFLILTTIKWQLPMPSLLASIIILTLKNLSLPCSVRFLSTGWTSTIRATITKLMLNSLAWYIIMNNTIMPNTQEICLNWWPPWKGSTIEESNWHHERGDSFGQISIQAVGGTVYQNNLFQQRAPPQIGPRTQTIWIKDSFQTNWNCQSLLPLQGRAWRSQHAQ